MDAFSLHNRKVVIVGRGNVGDSIVYALTIKNLAREIVLVNRTKECAIGEALDIQHGIPFMGMSAIRCGDYEDCRDCDLIIITAGQNRKVGETKLDLAKDNVEVFRSTREV